MTRTCGSRGPGHGETYVEDLWPGLPLRSGLAPIIDRISVAPFAFAPDPPEEPQAPTLQALQAELDRRQGPGEVTGPVSHQLDGHLECAARHVEAGRIAQATGEIERFLRRLDRLQPTSHVSADAAATLRSLAEGVLDSWS